MSIFNHNKKPVKIPAEKLLETDNEKQKKYITSYIRYYILGIFGQYIPRLDILHFLDNSKQIKIYFDAIDSESDLYDIFDITSFVYEECLDFFSKNGIIKGNSDDNI